MKKEIKEKIIDIIKCDYQYTMPHEPEDTANKLLSLFSQILDEKIKKIEELKIDEGYKRTEQEPTKDQIVFEEGFNEALFRVLSILKENH